ncbi:TIGR03032 family protein [Tychonema sp. BBK16]|uniref:TIGR03032 family protein n=1 Tax=Tychonema sp. BBK16 TaxID=2699888 RepID=UPI001F28D833|nr:TIGR03032 family protein [Tychonema sp. BBK16]MCF6375844.1 TIGR03032 family protein [Tychonema sp. BBK16]
MSDRASPETMYDRALTLQKQGNWEGAQKEYQQIIAQQPDYAPAYFQLGNAKLVKQEWQSAIARYRQALNCEQRYSQAWYNLGVCLENIGDIEGAIATYQQAITYNPNYAIAYNSLGSLLEKQYKGEAAKIAYQKAAEIQPDSIAYLGNLARIQFLCEQYAEAAANYQKVLQLDPTNINAMSALVKINQWVCRWEHLTAALEKMWQIGISLIEQDNLQDFSVFDFIMFSPFGPDRIFAIARYYAKFISSKIPQNYLPPHVSPDATPQKLRIGYIAGDFYKHALTHLMLELFALHDRTRFEIFTYSLGPNDGSFERQKIEADSDKFIDLRGLTTAAAAEKIYSDRHHILVDMGAYTQHSNPGILAMRPAPIQINYLTYASTMGADYIDYIITDNTVTPPHLAEFFSEKFICLPDSYQINNYRRVCPAENPQVKQQNPKAKYGLPEDAFVFGCFNYSRKIEPVMFDVWMRILQQVPNSVLWLLECNPEATQNLKNEAQLRGIDPNRLIFGARLLQEEHLARHVWIDLFLDTLYCNAHTTGSDALWMGIPFITCPGETFAARVGASLLEAVNLPELIVNNLAEYEQLAIHLATNPQELQQLKDYLYENRRQFPLFDTPRTVRHIESAYLQVWERFRSHLPPAAIQIEPTEENPQETAPKNSINLLSNNAIKSSNGEIKTQINAAKTGQNGQINTSPDSDIVGAGSPKSSPQIENILNPPRPDLTIERSNPNSNAAKTGQNGQINTSTGSDIVGAGSPQSSPQIENILNPPRPDLMIDRSNANSEEISVIADRDFPLWLQEQKFSIACTTYQTSRLILIGAGAETDRISIHWRIFDRAMGLYCTGDRFYLSSKYQLWVLNNVLESGNLYQGGDRLYVPRIAYTTGDIDIHDIAVDKRDRIIFISTLFNCIATVSDRHSCKPLWKPPFISQYINEDRCHLNGLAMVDGEAKYVTAVSRSDAIDGWRDRRKNGGIVIDVPSNEIVVTGLSMPHSPRWYRDKLWLLNSGRGEFGYVDLATGKFEAIAFCPGYLRGLAFWQNWAIVGLSKPRGGDNTFSGLELDELLAQKDVEPRCGMMVIDLNSGAIVRWLKWEGLVTELYDVQVISNAVKPMALGFQTSEIAQLVTLET